MRACNRHSGVMDMLLSMLGGKGMSGLFKTGTAILTILLVVPALLKIFVVTVDEGWAAIRTRNGKPIIRNRPQRRPTSRGMCAAGRPTFPRAR
jgi:hypothetical protein